jgi:hypothetical protein
MQSTRNSVVVINHAPENDYSRDFVSLPREYGRPVYQKACLGFIPEAVRG